jgi:hypothetical protein
LVRERKKIDPPLAIDNLWRAVHVEINGINHQLLY